MLLNSKPPLHIFTVAYGQKAVDLFIDCAVRSFCWPLNKDALVSRNATWHIWTLREDFPVVAEAASRVGINLKLNEADSFIERLSTDFLNDNGVMMLQMWLHTAKIVRECNGQLFTGPTDTIMSGESVPNILQAGELDGTAVAVGHIRVHPNILKDIEAQANRFGPASSIGSARLVSLALRNAHKSFTEAEFYPGKDRINSYIGGIMWQRRPSGVIAMTHRLPTVYLVHLTDDDINYFSRKNPPGTWPPVYGEWDHSWPSACLFPKQRMRYLGSSDDAFMCEITDPEKNVPPLQHYVKGEPDLFWRDFPHNAANRQFVVTLRPDNA